MKITYPHIGDLTLGLEGLFESLDIDYMPPPAPGDAVLAAGARHSPETVCLPYKHVLGELILNLEKGADTLMLLGGKGPCRFGFYDVIQNEVLRDLGHQFEVVSTDDPDTLKNLISELKAVSPKNTRRKIAWEIYLFFRRMDALDEIQDRANKARWAVVDTAALDEITRAAKRKAADGRSLSDLRRAKRYAREEVEKLPRREGLGRPLRVGICGEFYTAVDHHTNFHVERVLGDLGAEVHRGVWISQWLNDRFHFRPLTGSDRKRCKKIAKPYLEFSPGGECVVTLARVIEWHKQGFDGAVHLLPFTCMPELVAASILSAVTRDHPLPVLRLVIDEHTDGTGVRTRLEAFVDTLRQRRT